MPDNSVLPILLEPTLPGAWIAKHRRIWQMNFLNAHDLARFCSDRGLSDVREEGITQLWQLGLLKADLVECDEDFILAGLVDRGVNHDGLHVYSDERQIQQRSEGWGNALKALNTLRDDVELLFHPFRYYVLYHLIRTLGLNISRMQMFNQEGYQRVLDFSLSMFNNWSQTEGFITSIEKWNNVASLCIITEPCVYVTIFQSIRYNPFEVENPQAGAAEIYQHIDEYWYDVNELYHHVGMERLEELRQELSIDTQRLDSNRWMHTLLCLGDSKLRLELKDHLGGALFLRTMAEMLRRGIERGFNTTLREEDELGFGWVPEGVKDKIYGSNRLLEDQRAAGKFTEQYGLNFKTHVHLYVEGDSEFGAYNSFFKTWGITVTNLHGLVKKGKSKTGDPLGTTYFRDYLRNDRRNAMYSIVLIDADVRENVKVLERAAVDDELFGAFFLSNPDFEFANFEVAELEEVLWRMAGKENPSQKDRDHLHSYVKDATKSSEFFRGVESAAVSLLQLIQLDKGEAWGEELMKFAWENQYMRGKKRQLIVMIDLALLWMKTTNPKNYAICNKHYRVDPATGRLVERSNTNP